VSKHYEGITLSCLLFVIASIFFGEMIRNQSLWIIVSGIFTIIAITAYFINFFSEDINLLQEELVLKEKTPEVPEDMNHLEQHKPRPLVLKKADQAQTEFLSQIVHEFRTPLSAVTAGVNALLERSLGNLTDEQKKMLVIVERNALKLVNLINDILELTRVQARQIEIETFNLDNLLNDVANRFKQEAAQKGLTFDLIVQADLPPIHSARGALVQVLGNLMSNAIKFSEAGNIIVEATQSGENPEQVEIRVKESGIGERDLRRILDTFYHGEGEKTGGMGLGLIVTKHLVEILGGSLTVESKPKQTAVWKVQIPRDLLSRDAQ